MATSESAVDLARGAVVDTTVLDVRAPGGPVVASGLPGAPVVASAPSRYYASVRLLGGFGLQVEGREVALAPVPQRLVALLGLHEDAVSRTYVAGQLWGDSTEARAQGSLRTTLSKLQASDLRLIDGRGGNLALRTDVDVDVRRVSTLAQALVLGTYVPDNPDPLEPRLCHDLLPGWYDEWVLAQRERHRQLSLHALESLCDYHVVSGQYGAAVLAGLAAVAREPLRESAHRALMRAHLAEGNAGEAIAQYRRYETMAARDLGVEPSARMRSLLDYIAVDVPLTKR